MKYLYKILRLFICPHKYKIIHSTSIESSSKQKTEWRIIGQLLTLQCSRCGNVKHIKETL